METLWIESILLSKLVIKKTPHELYKNLSRHISLLYPSIFRLFVFVLTGCITALEQLAHHQSHYAQFWLDLANAYYQYSHSEGESISYNFQVRIVTCYIRARFVFLLNDNYFVIIISIDLYSVPEIPQQHEMYVNQFRYSH